MFFLIEQKDIEILTSCPICQGKEFKCISSVNLENENITILSTDFCQHCGIVFRRTRPSSEWFRKSWKTRNINRNHETLKLIFNEELEKRRYIRYRNLAQALEKIINVQSKRMLDIGTGPGTGLKAFHDRSWIVTGLEPDPIRAKIGKERYGLNIIESTIEEYPKDNSNYDVATIIQTLEHFHDPLYFLENLVPLVKEEGHVYIEVPNIMNFVGWKDSLYLEHLLNFSEKNLTLLAKRVGLRPYYRFFPKTKPNGSIHLGILFQKTTAPSKLDINNIETKIEFPDFYQQIREKYITGLPEVLPNNVINFVVPGINDLRFTFRDQQKNLTYSKLQKNFIFVDNALQESGSDTSGKSRETIIKSLIEFKLSSRNLLSKSIMKVITKLKKILRLKHKKNEDFEEECLLALRYEKISQ